MGQLLGGPRLALAAVAALAAGCGTPPYVRKGPKRTVDIVHIATLGTVGPSWAPLPREVSGLTTSPDVRWAAYVVRVGDQFAVEVNGFTGAPYHRIYPGSIRVFGDGSVAYVAVDSVGQQFVVLKGVEGTRYEAVDSLSASADGMHHVYRARLGGLSPSAEYSNFQLLCVADGDEGPPFDYVGVPVLSADGAHFAYAGRRDGRDTLLVDGHPAGSYDYVSEVALSPDGSRAAVVAGVGKAPGWRMEHLLFGLGPTVAHLEPDAGKHRVVVDGVAGPECDWAHDLEFSADGRHLAFVASSGGEQFVVVDGVEQPRRTAIGDGSFRFSPDGRRFCYVAARENGWTLVVDGEEHPVEDIVSGPYFSPDSRHIAYVARERGSWQAYVDHEPRGQARPSWTSSVSSSAPRDNPLALTFSPDSAHIAYLAMGDKQYERYVAIDDTTGVHLHAIQPPIAFVTPRRVRYFATAVGTDGVGVLRLVEEELQDEPAPSSAPSR
jgi:hypothetical protein